MRAPYRNRFDPSRDFVVRKPMNISGRQFNRLEPFDKLLVGERRLRQLFSQRTIVYSDEATPGGQLSADQAAETFRGQRAKLVKDVQAKRAKEKAEKLAAELKAKEAAAPKERKARTPKAAKPAPAADAAPPAAEPGQQAQEAPPPPPAADGAEPPAPPPPAAEPPAPPRETVEGEAAILAARSAVEIPAGWADLPWTERLKLAAQLSDTPVRNGQEVADAVGKELARRGNP